MASSSSVLVLFLLSITLITSSVKAQKYHSISISDHQNVNHSIPISDQKENHSIYISDQKENHSISISDQNENHSEPNRIHIGSSLSANDNLSVSSWLSTSGRFAFGFYPQGNGFAVGIQLLNPPQNTVVWTANRDEPPVSSNSTLKLTGDGILLQTEGGHEVIINGSSSQATNATAAAMLDSGNFVLYNESFFVIWESFGFPTDTILGGQDLQTSRNLVSSASVADHSSGRFSLNMQDDGNLAAYHLNSSYTYWATMTLNDYYRLSLNLSGFLVLNGHRTSVLVSTNVSYHGQIYRPQDNQTTIYRATLDVDGVFRLYLHNFSMSGSSEKAVMVIWSAVHPCDVRGICGFNSNCEVKAAAFECRCYPGFAYNNPHDKSMGCFHNITEDSCTGNEEPRPTYKLEAVDNITLQNHPYSVTLSNETSCRNFCRDDCNCWAVLYADTDCRKYKLPLLYGNRKSNISSRGFIKVLLPRNIDGTLDRSPHFTIESKNNGLIIRILAICLGSIAFICSSLAILSFTVYMHRVHRYEKLLKHTNLALADQQYFSLQAFSYNELQRATDGFKEEIGRGTYGAVYKGILSGSGSNKPIAVKRLEKVVEEGIREFKAEITTIGRTHHRNLVQLLGFCIEGSRKLLVYDYMSNGSLADLLYKARGIRPSWKERVQLVFDVAKGVLYLHDECSVHIIHSNLKPQNILLDHTWTAKISDFGLARLVPNETKINSAGGGGGEGSVEQVRRGYLAPEWQNNALISVKADIYSFGIVLLEIVCCRRNIELNVSTPDEIVLSSWVSKCFAAAELKRLVDEDEHVDLKTLERMVKVGLWCVQDDPTLRPFMRNVILMLEGTMDIPVPPCPKLPSLV